MSTPGRFYDGSFAAAAQQGPPVPAIDPVTGATLYTVRMCQLASKFKKLARSSRGPLGSYLDEEGTASNPAADILEWERHFATVPESRTDFEEYVHPYQTLTDGVFGETGITVQSRLTYDYFFTFKPETDITCIRAYRYQPFGNGFLQTGTPPSPDAQWILAVDDMYRRWKADIYERVRREVPKLAWTPVT